MRFSCFAHKPAEGPEEGIEHLSWNGQPIAFTIRRGSARRKRTLIRVTRTGKVEVVLPPRLPRRAAFSANVSGYKGPAPFFALWLRHRKWLMLFSLKFQRNNRKNTLTEDSAKGKTGEKGRIFTVLWR